MIRQFLVLNLFTVLLHDARATRGAGASGALVARANTKREDDRRWDDDERGEEMMLVNKHVERV